MLISKVMIEDFISAQEWIFAKTYADRCPHEYVVVDNCDDRDGFYKFVQYIRHIGFDAHWFGKQNRYWIAGDGYYYWTMGAPVLETTIINRAKLSDYRFHRDKQDKIHIFYEG